MLHYDLPPDDIEEAARRRYRMVMSAPLAIGRSSAAPTPYQAPAPRAKVPPASREHTDKCVAAFRRALVAVRKRRSDKRSHGGDINDR